MKRRVVAKLSALAWLGAFAAIASGCAHLLLDDCPEGGVLGKDTVRLRTSHYRIEIASRPIAARRFAPYALMATYAYHDDPGCNADEKDNRIDTDRAESLAKDIAAASGWTRIREMGTSKGCEDARTGFLYHVWQRSVNGRTEIAIVFRGTSGWRDWLYGNAWWLTRFFNDHDQISQAREEAGKVIAEFKAREKAAGRERPRFVSTGHSLGGGLAQHTVYAYPNDVDQAIAFDSSSVTGSAAVDEERQREACSCRDSLAPEARMMRVYESYEVLSNLRIFHKVFLPPERHVQEVRFPYDHSWNPVAAHSMLALAQSLQADAARVNDADKDKHWYASKDSSCTPKVVAAQKASCSAPRREGLFGVCPR